MEFVYFRCPVDKIGGVKCAPYEWLTLKRRYNLYYGFMKQIRWRRINETTKAWKRSPVSSVNLWMAHEINGDLMKNWCPRRGVVEWGKNTYSLFCNNFYMFVCSVACAKKTLVIVNFKDFLQYMHSNNSDQRKTRNPIGKYYFNHKQVWLNLLHNISQAGLPAWRKNV